MEHPSTGVTQVVAAQPVLLDSHPAPIKLSLWQRITKRGESFLFLSIVFHLLLLAGAAVYVVRTINKEEKLKFKGAGKSVGAPGQKALEYKVQTAKRNQNMSTPLVTSRLTSSASSAKVAIPEAPPVMGNMSAMPTMLGAMGAASYAGGGGAGGVAGEGMGVGGAMAAMPATVFSVFGFKGPKVARGLTGTLYDLKQTADLKPSELAGNLDLTQKFMLRFSATGFDKSLLKKYFAAPVELSAHRFWIPNMPVVEMPRAFGVEKEVKAVSLMACYRGRITPPKDGTYRFVAIGDDFLGIKFNGKVILPFDRPGSRIYPQFETNPFYIHKKGHAVSDSFVAKRLQEFEIEVVLAELPGGLAAYNILIECQEDLPKYKKTASGLPIIPVFELDGDTPIPEYQDKPGLPTLMPPRDPNRMVWKVVKDSKIR